MEKPQRIISRDLETIVVGPFFIQVKVASDDLLAALLCIIAQYPIGPGM